MLPDDIQPSHVDGAGVAAQFSRNGDGERRLIERRARAALLDGWKVILDDPLENGMALHSVLRIEQFRVVADVLRVVLVASELDGHRCEVPVVVVAPAVHLGSLRRHYAVCAGRLQRSGRRAWRGLTGS